AVTAPGSGGMCWPAVLLPAPDQSEDILRKPTPDASDDGHLRWVSDCRRRPGHPGARGSVWDAPKWTHAPENCGPRRRPALGGTNPGSRASNHGKGSRIDKPRTSRIAGPDRGQNGPSLLGANWIGHCFNSVLEA